MRGDSKGFFGRVARLRSRLARARQLVPKIESYVSARRRRRWIFQQIYENKLWGGDSQTRFYSGVGSRGIPAAIYVERMSRLLSLRAEKLGRAVTVVDLGCGDFAIGRNLVSRVE